ncbi:MAG: 50S ribosomal protein L18 [Nitrospinae bacterium]|nr:50S ribosomal protein L18 [Nitrospinota bacterium]
MENSKIKNRLARKNRIRKKIKGDSERPRLTVYKSLKHIYAQVIDDAEGKTLAYASTMGKEFKDKMKAAKNMEAAKLIGELIAEKAIQKGIKRLVFDRNSYLYHGKVAAIVTKVREKGITI